MANQYDIITNLLQSTNSKIKTVFTLSLGIINTVYLDTMTCDLTLKHTEKGLEVPLYNVPIAVQTYNNSSITVAPKENDIVLIAFTRNDPKAQLENNEIVHADEQQLYDINHAIVIAGIYTKESSIPSISDGEILIKHKSGSEIRIHDDGSIKLTSPNSLSSIELTSLLGIINITSLSAINIAAPLITLTGLEVLTTTHRNDIIGV